MKKLYSFITITATTALLITLLCIPVIAAGDTNSSDEISSEQVTITNNVNKNDLITITGLVPKSIVFVYSSVSGKTAFIKKKASGNSLTLKIKQLGEESGSVWISVTEPGLDESERTEIEYEAEPQSTMPDEQSVIITNNAKGIKDLITIEDIGDGDKITVYNEAGTKITSGKGKAASGTFTKKITQLGAAGGILNITVTSKGMRESEPLTVSFEPEQPSAPLNDTNEITITNGMKSKDYLSAVLLEGKDIINIYAANISNDGKYSLISIVTDDEGNEYTDIIAANKGKLLKSLKCSASKDEINKKITSLGSVGGYLLVTRTSYGYLESEPILVAFDAEEITAALDKEQIFIENNVTGTKDTIDVISLTGKDTIKVYETATSTKVLAKAKVASSKDSVTIKISQLGVKNGTVYITNTGSDAHESARVPVPFEAEGITIAPDIDDIIVTNNALLADTVEVFGVNAGATVRIYGSSGGITPIAKATVSTYGTSVTLSVSQLDSYEYIYISSQNANARESTRTQIEVPLETVSKWNTEEPGAIKNHKIRVENNSGIADTIYIEALTPGSIINVYTNDIGGNSIGKGVVETYASSVTISIDQLGSGKGTIYLTLTTSGNAESLRLPVDYDPEDTTSFDEKIYSISVNNQYGIASTVKVAGLLGGDVIRIYGSDISSTPLASGTVEANQSQVIIELSSLSSGGDNIWLTRTTSGKAESNRLMVTYSAHADSVAPSLSSTEVINNYGIADTITVKSRAADDIIYVYNDKESKAASALLGYATVAQGGSSVTISVAQLGEGSGIVYISAQSTGKKESERTAVSYDAEKESEALGTGDVTVTNNSVGTSDSILVYSLAAGDVVKVYKSQTTNDIYAETISLGSSAEISVTQLGLKEGSIWISVTKMGKKESERTEISYLAESAAPLTGAVTVINNYGIADTITVTNRQEGDTVNIYSAAAGGVLLASGIVKTDTITLTVSQLTSTASKIYVSVTEYGKCESARTEIFYSAEQQTNSLVSTQISVINSGGTVSLSISGLNVGDLIQVYNLPSAGTLLASASATASSVNLNITNLQSEGGTLYISITSNGKSESNRLTTPYPLSS